MTTFERMAEMVGVPAITDEIMLGTRLRDAREARGLSLKNVEEAARGALTASMLSAYERGEHAITAHRLCLLAGLYDLSMEELLEVSHRRIEPIAQEPQRDGTPIRFEVRKLEGAKGPEAKALWQLIRLVEERRSRRNRDWIEIRNEDLFTLAASLGRSVDSLVDSLRKCDVLRRPQGRPPASTLSKGRR